MYSAMQSALPLAFSLLQVYSRPANMLELMQSTIVSVLLRVGY